MQDIPTGSTEAILSTKSLFAIYKVTLEFGEDFLKTRKLAILDRIIEYNE